MEKFRYVLMHRSIPSGSSQVFPCKPTSRFSPFIVGTIVGAESSVWIAINVTMIILIESTMM